MSGKTMARDERGNPVKMPGWFSWRHETREAHDAAVLRYLLAHHRAARRKGAAARLTQLKGSAFAASSVLGVPDDKAQR